MNLKLERHVLSDDPCRTEPAGRSDQEFHGLLRAANRGPPPFSDHLQAARRSGILDSTRQCATLAPLVFHRETCRDQGPGTGGGLDHQNSQGQTGDNSVPSREIGGSRWSLKGKLTDQSPPAIENRIEEGCVLGWIAAGQSAAQNNGGPPPRAPTHSDAPPHRFPEHPRTPRAPPAWRRIQQKTEHAGDRSRSDDGCRPTRSRAGIHSGRHC